MTKGVLDCIGVRHHWSVVLHSSNNFIILKHRRHYQSLFIIAKPMLILHCFFKVADFESETERRSAFLLSKYARRKTCHRCLKIPPDDFRVKLQNCSAQKFDEARAPSAAPPPPAAANPTVIIMAAPATVAAIFPADMKKSPTSWRFRQKRRILRMTNEAVSHMPTPAISGCIPSQ